MKKDIKPTFKKAVLTALFGNTGDLISEVDPKIIEPDCEYIAVVDDNITVPFPWKKCLFNHKGVTDPVIKSRIVKMFPWVFTDATTILYMDASIRLTTTLEKIEHDTVKYEGEFDIAAFQHFKGVNIYKHITDMVNMGKETDEGAVKAMMWLLARKFPFCTKLWHGGFILYRKSQAVEEFGKKWFEFYMNCGSKRDQFTLPVAVREANIRVASIPGNNKNGEYCRYVRHDIRVSKNMAVLATTGDPERIKQVNAFLGSIKRRYSQQYIRLYAVNTDVAVPTDLKIEVVRKTVEELPPEDIACYSMLPNFLLETLRTKQLDAVVWLDLPILVRKPLSSFWSIFSDNMLVGDIQDGLRFKRNIIGFGKGEQTQDLLKRWYRLSSECRNEFKKDTLYEIYMQYGGNVQLQSIQKMIYSDSGDPDAIMWCLPEDQMPYKHWKREFEYFMSNQRFG